MVTDNFKYRLIWCL